MLDRVVSCAAVGGNLCGDYLQPQFPGSCPGVNQAAW